MHSQVTMINTSQAKDVVSSCQLLPPLHSKVTLQNLREYKQDKSTKGQSNSSEEIIETKNQGSNDLQELDVPNVTEAARVSVAKVIDSTKHISSLRIDANMRDESIAGRTTKDTEARTIANCGDVQTKTHAASIISRDQKVGRNFLQPSSLNELSEAAQEADKERLQDIQACDKNFLSIAGQVTNEEVSFLSKKNLARFNVLGMQESALKRRRQNKQARKLARVQIPEFAAEPVRLNLKE